MSARAKTASNDQGGELQDARGGRFWMDDDIIDQHAAKIGPYALAVYTYLCRRANKQKQAIPSLKRMGIELSMSRSTVQKAIETLEAYRLISVTARKLDDSQEYTSNLYTILDASRGIGVPSHNTPIPPHNIPYTATQHTVYRETVTKEDTIKEDTIKDIAADAALTPTLPRKETEETVDGIWDAIQAVPEDIRRRPERVAPGSARDLDLALEYVCFDTQDSRETLALHRSWIAKERNALREINKHLDQPITGQEVRDKFKRGGIWYATWMAEDGRKPNPAEVTKYVRRLENEVKSAARLQREAQSTARTVVYPTIEPPAPISEDERRENLYILSRRPFAPKAASA